MARPSQAMEGEVRRQEPLVDATKGRIGDAHQKVRETHRQNWNYNAGR